MMRIALFYHSLLSCWNHGNAHFLRGVASELVARGHDVRVFEPRAGWSLTNLLREQGAAALDGFYAAYPQLDSTRYDLDSLDLDWALDGVNLVLVHEWSSPELVAKIGRHRAAGAGYRLLFHDTHHRAITAPDEMARFDLSSYDGVLAFGGVLRDLYLERGWARRAFTWHEAADTRVFRPRRSAGEPRQGDVVWIGNWGDGERDAELREFLVEPVRGLGLRGCAHGVRYPGPARRLLEGAGFELGGWLPNHAVPEVFARHAVTVHVPRQVYARAMPGIPTIRPFEAMACGIPLISSPWEDRDRLFTAGQDYLVARDGAQMREHLRAVLADRGLARALGEAGRRTILERHTCAHRVSELLGIYRALEDEAAGAGEIAAQRGA